MRPPHKFVLLIRLAFFFIYLFHHFISQVHARTQINIDKNKKINRQLGNWLWLKQIIELVCFAAIFIVVGLTPFYLAKTII